MSAKHEARSFPPQFLSRHLVIDTVTVSGIKKKETGITDAMNALGKGEIVIGKRERRGKREPRLKGKFLMPYES